jgi:hypothetical protein
MDIEKEPIKPLFPEYLLERSADERLTYFCDLVIAHQALKEALEQLLQLLRHPAKGLVVLVYGPSGVGKTTLALKVLWLLLKEGMARMDREPGHIAAGYMELVNAYRAIFDWRRYFLDMLLVYRTPPTLLERNVAYSWATSPDSGSLLQVRERSSIDALTRAAENALIRCKPDAHLLDEGNHLLRAGAGADRIDNQMDTIKSMANRTNVPHVLFGTYKLLRFADLHGQLSRRAEQVHLRRYNIYVKADETAFLGVLNTFQRQLPLAEMPDLVGDVDFLYIGSLGCVGTLKEWLDRALKRSLYGKQKRGETFHDHLVATALSDASLIQIMTEAKEGEDEMAQMRGPERRKEITGLLAGAPRAGRIRSIRTQGTDNASMMALTVRAAEASVAESSESTAGRGTAGSKGKGKAAGNGNGKGTRGARARVGAGLASPARGCRPATRWVSKMWWGMEWGAMARPPTPLPLPTYDTWDLSPVALPPRSRLYPLEPIGIGTPYVESLTSYIARLAEAYCVSPVILVRWELAAGWNASLQAGRRSLKAALAGVNGTRPLAETLVEAVERLTLQANLRCLTMRPWSAIFSDKHLLRDVRAWCSFCLDQMRVECGEIYEPLLWSILNVEICPIHGRMLQDVCPGCYETQPIIRGTTRVGFCVRCGIWLGHTFIGTSGANRFSHTPTPAEEWLLWAACAVGELLACAPHLPDTLAPGALFNKVERFITDPIMTWHRSYERMFGADALDIKTLWQHETTELLSFLIFCYRIRIQPVQFLTQESCAFDATQRRRTEVRALGLYDSHQKAILKWLNQI